MTFGLGRATGAVTLMLSFLLVAAIFSAAAGNGLAYGQNGVDDNDGDEQATPSSPLRGQVSSIQMGEDGEPAWIQSGIWVMRISPTDDPDAPNVSLIARMAMVMVNGSAMHSHSIYGFELESHTVNNATHTYEGTATVTMREGPVSGVPVVVEILNNAVIAMTLGPDEVESHFGTGPVYGTLSEGSQNATEETATWNDMAQGAPSANNNSTSVQP